MNAYAIPAARPAGLGAIAFGVLLAGAMAFPAAAAGLSAQKSSDRGVTVTVTSRNLSSGANSWDFKVVLDTHSGELNDDLVKTTKLLDDKGARHAPVKWEGAGPGGHHREGTLRFSPISPRPTAIKLQIQRVGEPKPREFRWQIR